mmetsp:Transcript_44099/g.89002  ORF Transcript_44099/g.89002 Transcript_44099/m.89002 type:complete len:230 (-) Transcript_44099:33-722(-)
MLRGDDDGVELLRLDGAVSLLQVLDRDLRLAIGPQPPERAVLAHVRQLLAQLGRDGVRQRHAVGRLVRGVPEHDALISGPDVEILLANVDAAGDVWALLVDSHEHLARLVAEPLAVHAGQVVDVGVEADVGNDPADHLLVVQLGLRGDLARDHHHVVLGRRLTGHLALRVASEAGIQNRVRDLVAELIRMALVHGFRREEELALSLGLLRCRLPHRSCCVCKASVELAG